MAFFPENHCAKGFSSDIEYRNSAALPEDMEMEMDGHGLFAAHYNEWDAMSEFDQLIITDMEETRGCEEIAHLPLTVRDTKHSPISVNNQFPHVSAVKIDRSNGRKLRRKIQERQNSDFVQASANFSATKEPVKVEKSNPSGINSTSTTRQENFNSSHISKSSDKNSLPTSVPSKKEAIKDYVYLRARKGEATHNHSLAERARREKVKERMQRLQELVPGCCKVTGKARILDEIINYVQSMQNQVQYLSGKLACVAPLCHLQLDNENLLSTEGPNQTIISDWLCS